MADRVPASITLGGTISTAIRSGLDARIAEAALSTDWDGPDFTPEHRIDGVPLALFAHEVAGGEFSELEEYCCEHGIAFARWSGACPRAFAAERVVFPGAGVPRSYTTDEEDRILIARDTVEALGDFEAVLAYFDDADFEVPPLIVIG